MNIIKSIAKLLLTLAVTTAASYTFADTVAENEHFECTVSYSADNPEKDAEFPIEYIPNTSNIADLFEFKDDENGIRVGVHALLGGVSVFADRAAAGPGSKRNIFHMTLPPLVESKEFDDSQPEISLSIDVSKQDIYKQFVTEDDAQPHYRRARMINVQCKLKLDE